MADTIADTRLFHPSQRLQALEDLRRLLWEESSPTAEKLKALQAVALPQNVGDDERRLFLHLPECLRLFYSLSDIDRHLIRKLVLTLTRGMEMDLAHFLDGNVVTIHILPDLTTLDQYIYYVAGVVGEFWTEIHSTHLSMWHGNDLSLLCTLGVRFGKGLQMTNILKDLGRDISNGRCYLPMDCLISLGINIKDLNDPAILPRIRPLINTLSQTTLDHLDHARDYILHFPACALRSRLSCMWPLLFAVQTLQIVYQSDRLLHPATKVKISRQTIYWTIFCSLWCLIFPALFPIYYAHLRQRLIRLLEADRFG
jgi:farnesyl-diphosphate farnesyltransferase